MIKGAWSNILNNGSYRKENYTKEITNAVLVGSDLPSNMSKGRILVTYYVLNRISHKKIGKTF